MENKKELLVPDNCTIIRAKKYAVDRNGVRAEEVDRCFPDLSRNQLRVYKMGSQYVLRLTPVGIAPGISTAAIHDYNVATGWIDSEIDAEDAAEESLRTSISRSKRIVRELAACNPWDYFVTVTLSPKKWDRMSGNGLQKAFSDLAQKWKKIQKNGTQLYREFRYMLIPEPHKDGAIHIHGLVREMPQEFLKVYTPHDLSTAKVLPQYVADCVTKGKEILHCTAWDDHFGYNVLEPIRNLDRIATYITKYMTKELGTLPLKHRIWHSRGLQRATLVAKYDTSANMDDTIDVLELMKSVAIVLPSGNRLYSEYKTPACSLDRTHVYESLRCVTSTVDGNEIPIEHLLAQLDKMFPAAMV